MPTSEKSGIRASGCKECGGMEFVTEPNRYGVYFIDEDGVFLFMNSEFTQDEEKYYCRECSAEFLPKSGPKF